MRAVEVDGDPMDAILEFAGATRRGNMAVERAGDDGLSPRIAVVVGQARWIWEGEDIRRQCCPQSMFCDVVRDGRRGYDDVSMCRRVGERRRKGDVACLVGWDRSDRTKQTSNDDKPRDVTQRWNLVKSKGTNA